MSHTSEQFARNLWPRVRSDRSPGSAANMQSFLADPQIPHNWRCSGMANGNMGDLAPHPINAALALMGPIEKVLADVECVHPERPGGAVTNDDHAQIMCRFSNGVMGHIYSSRLATGRKMGYAYEVHGTEGAIRFDQARMPYGCIAQKVRKLARLQENTCRASAPRLSAFLSGAGTWNRLSEP